MTTQRRYDKAPPSLSRSGAPPVKHVWCRNVPGHPGTWPGVIVEWQQRPGGWHARVVFVVPSSHTDVLMERWFIAASLIPIPVEPPA